ncbi:MAG TPA: glycosyl hydrolase [Acidimicrobiales bacterium]|nr:glycosyl hydrolase [Acidimicrobiales bacterium]
MAIKHMDRLDAHRIRSWLGVLAVTAVCTGTVLVPGAAASAVSKGPASTSTTVSAGKSPSTTQPPSTASTDALGVYAGAGNLAGVKAFAAGSKQPVTYAMDFFNGATWTTIDHPQGILAAWFEKGYSMVWGVPMLPNKGGASLAAGATGAYDQHFVTLARAMVAAGQGSSIIRMGWEFNGIWFPWGAKGHASQFVAYWRHIVTAMRSVPGAHFTFEWNPSRGDLGVGNLAAFYPGNKYVDYIGLDVFDVEWQSYPGAKAEFANIQTGPYGLNWLAAFSKQHNKPMVFPEWGLGWGQSHNGAALTGSGAVGGGDNRVFITDMTHWFATHRVFEATYWDFGSSSVAGSKNQSVRLAFARNAAPQARLAHQ